MNLVGTANQKGRVAEWSNAVVLKTTVPQGTVGSNPTPSAFFKANELRHSQEESDTFCDTKRSVNLVCWVSKITIFIW